MFAYTNEEVGRLNNALREIEIGRGRVDPSHAVTIKTERFGAVEFAQGDRVQFRSNDKRAGIVNGLLGTVQQAAPDGRVQVLAETGRTIEFSANDENRPEIQHGYAGTIYRGQGKTLDDAYLLHTRHWRDRTSYVALTRARDTAKLFVARDQARGVTALARQMGRAGDAGSSLQYATAEEVRRRETGKTQTTREAFTQAGRAQDAQRQAPTRSLPFPSDERTSTDRSGSAGATDPKAEQRAHIEQWANTLKAARQSHQLSERVEMERRHARRLERQQERLDAFYGRSLREAKKELTAIEERQGQSGLVYRMSGQSREDRLQAERLRMSIADTINRLGEAMDKVRADIRQEREAMEEGFAVQRQFDERQIAEAYRRGEIPHANQNAMDRERQKELEQRSARGQLLYKDRSRDRGYER